MSSAKYAIHDNRAVLEVSGEDTRTFLQGLVSNDVNKVGKDNALYAAFLTPQGKFLHDFFMIEVDGNILLVGERDRLGDLMKRLKMYKLRSKVELNDALEDYRVAVIYGESADVAAALGLENKAGAARVDGDSTFFMDPRLDGAGAWAVLPHDTAEAVLEEKGLEAGSIEEYDTHRIELGLPEGSRDVEVNRAILLEHGFDELHGVDWDKGCFLGQELTARTKYRALIRKRLLPVSFEGGTPEPGDTVELDGKSAGEIKSVQGDVGMALLRLEHVEKAESGGAEMKAGSVTVKPMVPKWVRLPEPEAD